MPDLRLVRFVSFYFGKHFCNVLFVNSFVTLQNFLKFTFPFGTYFVVAFPVKFVQLLQRLSSL